MNKDKQLLEQAQEVLDLTTTLINNDSNLSLELYLKCANKSIVTAQVLASVIIDRINVKDGEASIYD